MELPSNMTDIWEKTLTTLRSGLTEVSFDTWIRAIRPLGLNRGNVLLLEVPTDFVRTMLRNRYITQIQTAVQRASGHPWEVDFVLPGTRVAPQQQPVRSGKTAATPDHGYKPPKVLPNPNYTFDSFVIGKNNHFAHAAALAVAQEPGRAYNPLFIYGGGGLGKTHLLHAISHVILSNTPRCNLLYVTSETFTNELIESIRANKTSQFRQTYRELDVLLIDDIQFIAGKDSTMEEFFHTFNALYDRNGQIILTSDKPPRDIPTLEDRLRSRFEWGLIADISAPDLETRVAILGKKASQMGVHIDNETLLYIAEIMESNIRELEGGLKRLIAYATVSNREINLPLAMEVLSGPHLPRRITADLISQTVSEYFGVPDAELKGKKRNAQIVQPRQYAMFLCRELTDLSLPRVGEYFGGRDHTTVMHSCDKIHSMIKDDVKTLNVINELKRRIQDP